MKRCRYFLSLLFFLSVILSLSCEPQGGIDISGPDRREDITDQRGGLGPPLTGEFRGGETEEGEDTGDRSEEPPPPSEEGPAPGIQRREITPPETPALIDTGVEKYFDAALIPPVGTPVAIYQKGGGLYFATLNNDRWEKALIVAPKEVLGEKVISYFHPSLALGGGDIKVAYKLDGEIKILRRARPNSWSSIDTEGLPPLSDGGHLDLFAEENTSNFHLAYRITGPVGIEYARITAFSIASPEIIRVDRVGGAVALTFGPRRRLYLFQQTSSNLEFKSLAPIEAGWTPVSGAIITSDNPFDLVGTISGFHLAYSGIGQLLRYIAFNERGIINVPQTAIIANGTNPSLALHNGNPFVTYYREQSLWLTKKTSSGWTIPIKIDGGSGKDVGEKSVIQIDSQGTAHVVYYDTLNKALRYYSRENP